MNRRALFFIAISVIITLLLLGWIGIENIIDSISSVSLSAFGWVLVLCAVAIVLDAIGLWLLLIVHKPISFFTFLPPYVVSWSIGSILPGRLGDFSLALFHKSLGVERKKIAVSVFLTKIITLFTIALLGWVLLGMGIIPPEWSGLLFVATLFLAVFSGIILVGKRINPILSFFHQFFPSIERAYAEWLETGKVYRRASWVVGANLLLTLVRFWVYGVSFSILLKEQGYAISSWVAGGLSALASLSVFAPFTFNGIGVRESLLVSLFGIVGVSPADAAVASLVQLVANYLLVIVLGILLWNVFNSVKDD